MRYKIQNDAVKVEIESRGAELKSIVDEQGREYLWCADPQHWNKTSPILFPVVGGVRGKQYTLDGKVYNMGQHGFGQALEYAVTEQKADEIWFSATDTSETFVDYPFHFRLEIGYRLNGKTLSVLWKVHNPDEKELWFSIGGHPAFNTPLEGSGRQTDCYLKFDRTDSFMKTRITKEGITDCKVMTTLENGRLKITEHTFDPDAIVIEDRQVKSVSLCQPDGTVYVTVKFDMPLVGVWSKSAEAPFVCIEPWCGMGDRIGFSGDFKTREYMNCLAPGAVFEQGYDIVLA